ncbi:MAG: response regulator [Verrucomicrobium sp.]|nr:response regulator transcription factor [Verrucomicrobium sp.]
MSSPPPTSASSTTKARILLVDDHRMVLEGYSFMLNSQPDLRVCGAAATAAEALSLIEKERPDLVITDLTMTGRGGLDLIKDVMALFPETKMLVCSMHDEMLYASRAMQAGAKGYLMKDADGPTFLAAVRSVLSGQRYMSERLAAKVLESFGKTQPRGSTSPLENLSDREFEVFRMFGEGKTAKEIAAQLNLSPKTVSVHRDHIKEKLGFSTSAEMIRQAVRHVESQE